MLSNTFHSFAAGADFNIPICCGLLEGMEEDADFILLLLFFFFSVSSPQNQQGLIFINALVRKQNCAVFSISCHCGAPAH